MEGNKPSPEAVEIYKIVKSMKGPYDYRETQRVLNEAAAKTMQKLSQYREDDSVVIVDDQGNEKMYHKIYITLCIEEERKADWECEVRFPCDGNDVEFFRVTREPSENCVYSRVVDPDDVKKVLEKFELYKQDFLESMGL
ncbi:MAG: hypothetical protein ACM3UU_00125 [Ignavibacteriales bacterium]